jgi:plasmid stabilization system protein ParE
MKVIWHPLAETELNEAANHLLEQDQPGLARRLILEAQRSVAMLSEVPGGGRLLRDGIRSWHLRVFRYSLIYRVGTDHVRILAVAHDRRRPYYWKSRG